MDLQTTERVRALLQQDIDWTYLIQTAFQHGMLPLLYRGLSSVCPEAVPYATLALLRDHFHRNARRNLFLTAELIKLVKLFEEHGILVVPFKGPVLAASVYGSLSLREFVDLDILVPERDVLRAKDLLISHGFQQDPQLTDGQEAAFLRSGCELEFVRDDGAVTIDLHWDFTVRGFSFSFELDRLWERLETVSLAGKKILSLSPADLLLLLCLHGAKHYWHRLEWICGVAELIRSHQAMDWQRVMENASRLGGERVLLLGLLLARDLLRAVLPHEVLQRMRADRMAQSLATHVRKELFSETDANLRQADSWAFFLRMRERLRDQVRYFLYFTNLRLTPTAEDLALMHLPSLLFFLYYLLRPIRLFRVYGVSPFLRFLKRLQSF